RCTGRLERLVVRNRRFEADVSLPLPGSSHALLLSGVTPRVLANGSVTWAVEAPNFSQVVEPHLGLQIPVACQSSLSYDEQTGRLDVHGYVSVNDLVELKAASSKAARLQKALEQIIDSVPR